MIYEIPIIPGHVPPVIHISQGDSGRIVSLQITGDNIPAAAQAEIKGIRPDGAGVTQTVQYGTGTSKGLIVWAVNRLFTEIEGDAICEVYLNFNAQYIGTQNFILRVEKAAYKPDAPTPWSSVTITEPGTYNVRPYGEVIVDMEAGPQPEGTTEITENGTHDVAAYAAASVNVPQREEPSGTRTITQNGDYDVADFAEAPAPTAVPSSPFTGSVSAGVGFTVGTGVGFTAGVGVGSVPLPPEPLPESSGFTSIGSPLSGFSPPSSGVPVGSVGEGVISLGPSFFVWTISKVLFPSIVIT